MVVAILLTDTLVLKLKMDSEEDSSVLCSSLNDVTGDDNSKLIVAGKKIYIVVNVHTAIL